MGYCELADLLEIAPEQDLIDLTDDAGAGVVNGAAIDKAIGDTAEIIDGYLRGRYTLPLSPVPGMLNGVACDIALYRLYSRRVRVAHPETVTARYKDAIARLEGIQKGTIVLGVDGVAADTPDSSGIGISAGRQAFNDRSMGDYIWPRWPR